MSEDRKKTISAIQPFITVDPVLNPVAIKDRGEYLSTYQGTPTNLLNTLTGKYLPLEININDQATITQDKLTVFIDRYSEMTNALKNSTVKLLQFCVMRLSGANSFRNETPATVKKDIVFNIDDYIALRGLKDRKEARKQVAADLTTLFNTSLGWMEQSGKNVKAFDMMHICTRSTLERNGTIHFYFTDDFAVYLINAYEMKLPRLYWKINDKHNPNSSPLLWKISLQKKMNKGKPSEDILSVKTLLENSPAIPAYEELQRKNEVNRSIIEPLERDLNALEEALSWEYCNSGGTSLTTAQIEGFCYNIFTECYIKITWKNYPEQNLLDSRKDKGG